MYLIYPVNRIVNKKATVIFAMNSFYKKLHGWSKIEALCWSMNDWLFLHFWYYNPNTMNMRWHEGKRVDVTEKTQNNWSDSEICKWFFIGETDSVLEKLVTRYIFFNFRNK